MLDLLQKFDVPVPRYTSYPTVPHWNKDSLSIELWKESVQKRLVEDRGNFSLYVHLPFCENLCTFCACNKRITKNHQVEQPYIQALEMEWAMYQQIFPSKAVLQELHLGGGTPTFFSAHHLTRLLEVVFKDISLSDTKELSIEVHPNYTTEEHIRSLADMGFNRISIGVQDFDPHVQFLINRIQSYESTAEVVEWARKYGYHSLNVDLVYGLPHQQKKHISHTIDQISKFLPERIAFYSYAHVPWKSKGQRRYSEKDLPSAIEKWSMYQYGRERLTALGYKAIGMDHFALPQDGMWAAMDTGSLHRNFMGYTTNENKLLVGLGASAIGDSWNAFFQNEKTVENYQERIHRLELPMTAGHFLSEKDQYIRRLILDLMCKGQITWDVNLLSKEELDSIEKGLLVFEEEELIALQGNSLRVLPKGSLLIRNIASVFDPYLRSSQSSQAQFSKAI
jgi:oxygen-independent coproporphyrinogen III oxidase